MSSTLWLVVILALAIASPYLIGPILVRARAGTSAHHSFDAIPDEHARALFPASFFSTIYELEALGFSLIAHLSSASGARAHTIVSLLTNPVSKTMASVASIVPLVPGAFPVVTTFVEFTTEFEDGSEINTLNNPTVRIFYDVPKKTIIKIPHLKDMYRLYQVHLYLIGQMKSRAVLPDAGTEGAHFSASFEGSLAQQVELGFYSLDEAAERYRHTWRGAIRTAWRLLWPAKQILEYRQTRDGRSIAKAAGVR